MPLDLNDLTATTELSEAGARSTLARLLEQLTTMLPAEISAEQLSSQSKYPFKAAVLGAVLAHRARELAKNTIELFDLGKDLPAAFTSRAVMETSAILFHLAKRLERAVGEKDFGDTDEFLMRGLMGWSAPYSTWRPLRVGTSIAQAAKEIPNFGSRYNSLSDVVHPNWLGAQGTFATHDEHRMRAVFGKRESVGWDEILVALILALALLLHSFSRVEEIMPAFVTLSEWQVARDGL